jgi:protein phosphatase-4 regulatory subunit 3
MTDILFFSVPFLCTKRVALVMNGVASQHSQPQSLLNTSTISGPAGIADHISGAGSTSTSNQQALQHSPHHDSTSPNDTNLISDSPSPSDLEPLTTTAGVTEVLVPKEQPPGDKVGEGQEPVVIKEEGEVLHGTVNGQIELLEHTPEPSVGSGDAEVMVNDPDAQDWIPDADHELKRVKVCQPLYSRHLSIKLL